jgi:hypothetical protein
MAVISAPDGRNPENPNFQPRFSILPQLPRNKNPEATTPSAIWSSAKEAQTVVDLEA